LKVQSKNESFNILFTNLLNIRDNFLACRTTIPRATMANPNMQPLNLDPDAPPFVPQPLVIPQEELPPEADDQGLNSWFQCQDCHCYIPSGRTPILAGGALVCGACALH